LIRRAGFENTEERMHFPRGLCFFVIFLVLGAPAARAQGDYSHRRAEITPFAGSRFGGSIDLLQQGGPLGALNFKSNWDYGVIGDLDLLPNLQAEFLWNQQPTHLRAVGPTGRLIGDAGEETTNMYQGGFLYSFRDPETKLKPFIAAGIGLTHFSANPNVPFRNKFSYNFGAGVKYFLDRGRHLGLRFDLRYSPTRTTQSIAAVQDIFGNVVLERVDNYARQGQANLGIILRF
jgi:outer membrane protein W